MLTLGAFVRPEIPHSLTSRGESSDVMFAFSTNGSLMMLTVNCFIFLMLSAVSFWLPSGSGKIDTEISGGDCVTWLNQLRQKEHGQRVGVRTPELCGGSLRMAYLKGAKFSTPLSETEETNAMGRGTIPLIIIPYCMNTASQSGTWIYARCKSGDLTILLLRQESARVSVAV